MNLRSELFPLGVQALGALQQMQVSCTRQQETSDPR